MKDHDMRSAPARRGTFDRNLIVWPAGLALALIVLALWHHSSDDARSRGVEHPSTPPLAERSFGDARLNVPRTWTTLDRSTDHVTWGDTDRRHTVTLASTEASLLPLPSTVEQVVADSERQLPGTRALSRPEPIELHGHVGRGDAAVLARLRVEDGSRRELEIMQVWRRDARGQRDLVATWTSADGVWPVPVREALPLPAATR
jgi:hypothetical protein